jgi:hypothetical protein
MSPTPRTPRPSNQVTIIFLPPVLESKYSNYCQLSYSKTLLNSKYIKTCFDSGTDNIPARGGRGLGGYDYYTFTYDEEDGYEEDSLPGTGKYCV